MSEKLGRASSVVYPPSKMDTDLSPRKTLLVLVIVVGCFAVLWPKVFYPMIVGSANQYMKPSPIDKTTGCCDVISENDVNTIKIMSELCGTIIKSSEDKPPSGKEIVQMCRKEVLETCGIDISVVLQEQVKLGQSVKQILDEIRSLNGSLCLKYNFGVAPWRLGVPHRITVKTSDIRQERPHHLRSELIHPAFRERGRAIPHPEPPLPTRPPPRVVEGRPGSLPGMKPILGGAGHVVPPPKQGSSSMSVIMPIYTIGIVILFVFTLMKIIFRKQPDGVGGNIYPSIDSDPNFRREVFESEANRYAGRLSRDQISSKLVVNAMSALLDEVDQELEARRKGNEVASQDLLNGSILNGNAVKPQDDDQPTVKVLGMEMTASCEGGKKWSRPESPVLPTIPSPAEPVPPPQEIYLEGALPAQSQLLVSESAIEPQTSLGEDPAVILSGKMTLSVISVDSETGVEQLETIEGHVPATKEGEVNNTNKTNDANIIQEKNDKKEEATKKDTQKINEEESYLTEEKERLFHKIEAGSENTFVEKDTDCSLINSDLSKDIESFVSSDQALLLNFTNENTAQPIQTETIEKEVNDLIQVAYQQVEQKKLEEQIDQDIITNLEEMIQDSKTLTEETDLKELQIEEIDKIIESLNNARLENSHSIKEIIDLELDALSEETNSDNGKKLEESDKLDTLPTANENSSFIEEITNAKALTLEECIQKNIKSKYQESEEPETIVKIEKKTKGVTFKDEDTSIVVLEQSTPDAEAEESQPSIEKDKELKTLIQSDLQINLNKIEDLNEKTEHSNNQETSLDIAETSANEILEAIDLEESSEDEEDVEIEYEEESEEEEEEDVEDEESEEVQVNRNVTESISVGQVNGERSDGAAEESKYTTASGNTAAELDISDDEEDEEMTDEEEIIEIEEEIEDDEYEIEEGIDLNHIDDELEHH